MDNMKWNKINMRAKNKNLPPKEGEQYLFYAPTCRSRYYIGKFVENDKRKGTYFAECEFWDIPIKSGVLWMELPPPIIEEE